jgi:Ca-activated chloride channel family protein
VRIADVLNDFELTETGRYRLPDLQSGNPLDIVVQLRVGAQAVGTTMRLLDLRLGFTPQDLKNAEVVREHQIIEFAPKYEVERLPKNYEVVKATQFLMNARARNEAMKQMDLGDFSAAEDLLACSLRQTRVACAPMMSSPAVMQESSALEEALVSLKDRGKDKLNRKKLAYGAYRHRSGK